MSSAYYGNWILFDYYGFVDITKKHPELMLVTQADQSARIDVSPVVVKKFYNDMIFGWNVHRFVILKHEIYFLQ